MRVDKIDITQIKDSDTLLAFYHMNIEPIRKGYKNLLNKKFDGCEKLPFHKFVQRINIEEIKHGDIIIKSIPGGSLSISIFGATRIQVDSHSTQLWYLHLTVLSIHDVATRYLSP